MREGKSLTGNQNFHGQESGATLKASGAEAPETFFRRNIMAGRRPESGRKTTGRLAGGR